MNEIEEEPELTYWKLTPKPPPPAVQPPAPVYPSFPTSFLTPQRPEMGVASHFPPPALPSTLCYPVTDVHMFAQQQQNAQVMTDNLIQEEVTRAAKTLFSKRNRTLMHWLNPNISMNQLKMDVNAAWDHLPPTEKVFYVSQVLGKFAPHTTSLMVNPQIDPTMSTMVKMESIDPAESGSGMKVNTTRKRTANTTTKKPRAKKQKVEYSSDDNISCDSALVVDMDRVQPRVKRKYTRREPKASTIKKEDGDYSSSNSCSLPVAIKDIKVEPGSEVTNPDVPRVKRKYVKRKLVRKKYKKRDPKNNTINDTQEEVVTSSVPEPQPNEATDVWMELDDTTLSREIEDFKLSNEEVDSFWASIDDPNNLFVELEIE